ncbi:MAG: hypothetical protein CMC15_13905 [Flavobacteriaceae bacterium]|nr:hypothetical protein [Flavobacteriaceae bacterium]
MEGRQYIYTHPTFGDFLIHNASLGKEQPIWRAIPKNMFGGWATENVELSRSLDIAINKIDSKTEVLV